MNKVVYRKRLTAPERVNGYYYNKNIFYQCNVGLPNCTCYAFGRWYELMGTKPKLYTGNAETWYPKGTAYDGYQRGQTPKLGAIACWSKGVAGKSSDGAGHVAVVEEIYSDGSFLTSNSGWKGPLFYKKKIGKNCKINGYTFQGFIYPPIEFVENVENSVENTGNTDTDYKVGQTYTTQVILRVRAGAGTNYMQKAYKNLTANAKENAYSDGINAGCLKAGTKVTLLQLKKSGNDIWGKIPSGWIAFKYRNQVYVK